jgi:SulP family sulfate permease
VGSARPLLPVRLTPPARGDLVAAVTVALVLIPQSLAYAKLAGLPVVTGLYTAVAATIAGGLIGSSRYLQTGPVALTSLLTLGALTSLAAVGSDDYVALAALLALVVGGVRVLIGLFRWGFVAYLMSQPVVSAFTVAAALLIVCSQLPALVEVPSDETSPVRAALEAVRDPGAWNSTALAIGVGMVVLVLIGRRISPLFPGAFVGAAGALLLTTFGLVTVAEVGDVPSGLPTLSLALPWSEAPSLLIFGVVIALVGFAEASSIARKYASEDRETWDPDREFVGQGLANVAAGALQGYPAGGSFSRSSLNRLSGARTRWSGVLAGVVVLAVMPVASALSGLPQAALAGLIIAAVLPLIRLRPFVEIWRVSKPQFAVALLTVAVTLASAPHVERGVLVGVGLSLAVHLWRELRIEVETWSEGSTLHVRPQGVLYFGSAPALEERVAALVAADPAIDVVVLHLERLGRLDVTGVLALRSLIDDMHLAGVKVRIAGSQPQAQRLLRSVLGDAVDAGVDHPERRVGERRRPAADKE